ncbi:MAG: hypothetical protein FWD69_01625 [Polyangiaceae bacterium]|nr:hypothetical protein [Polyangiaceae bacterium]
MIAKPVMKAILVFMLILSSILWILRLSIVAVYCPDRGLDGIAVRRSLDLTVRKEITPSDLTSYSYLLKPGPTHRLLIIAVYLWGIVVGSFVTTSILLLLALRYWTTRKTRPNDLLDPGQELAWLKLARNVFIAIFFFCFALRLFTVAIIYPGDALEALALRSMPMLENEVKVHGDEPSFTYAFILAPDHGRSGELNLYFAFVNVVFPISAIFSAMLIAGCRRMKVLSGEAP